MALMIPSVISPEVKSTAEKKIFEWFRSAPGTDDWIVLHSLGIATHKRVIHGEVDFFVLVPQMGVFALEVKGGRVRRENGTWYFTDRYDHTDSKTRGPFDQANDGVFSVVSALKDRIDSSHENLKNVFFGCGVMFPDIEYTANGIDELQWQVFDCRNGNNVAQYIKQLFCGFRDRWENVYGSLGQNRLPTTDDIKYLASLLRGDFDCVISLSAHIRNTNESFLKLTKEQYKCLDQLEDNPRCLIYGPAGTGKTLLALEDVKKSVSDGKRVALFCFNSNLAEWFKWYFNTLHEDLRPAYIGTFHKYMTHVAGLAGNTPPYPHDPDKQKEYYQNILPKAAVDACAAVNQPFDKIIVDEAQDLINDLYLQVMDKCLRKGIERGNWCFYGDFSMQAIYSQALSGKAMIKKLDDITAYVKYKLNINCRNTKQICQEIETVTGFVPPNDLWTKVSGPPVQYISWVTMEEQCSKLMELLDQLHHSNINPEEIVILSPKKREDSVVSMLSGIKIKDYHVPLDMNTHFCTIHGYKGLESPVIILVDIESFSAEQLMYVGLGRAKSGLFVLESEAAKNEYNTLLVRRLLQ